MIEINLLPNELRQAEGTPLPRLVTILVGVILVTMGGVVAFNYHFVSIKNTKRLIAGLNQKKTEYEAKAQEVRKLQDEINKATQKVAALRNLELSRIRWARLLYQFRKAIPQGCVISSWQVKAAGGAMAGGDTGKKYTIQLRGYTTGESDDDCTRMFREVSRNFQKYLRDSDVIAAGPAGSPPVKYAGFNKFVGLKFGTPVAGQVSFRAALSRPKLPEHMDEFQMPTKSMEFNISIPFALPPLETGG